MLVAVRRWFQQIRELRELERKEREVKRQQAEERARADRIAVDKARRQIAQNQRKILAILREGKVPDIHIWMPVPFRLQRNERLIFVQEEVGYAEVRVRRQVVGRSSGTSVRVARGVSVRSGESVGTPVETDVFTPRGYGLFAISTKHVFYNGQRTFRIPLGKVVSAQRTPEGDVEIVRDRASALPEFFGINKWDVDYVVSLIRLLPSVDFGRGEPQLQPLDGYLLPGGVGGYESNYGDFYEDPGGETSAYEEC